MNINGQGISLLQQLLENEEIEASNIPKQNPATGSTKRPHGNHHHGHHNSADEAMTGPDLVINPLQNQKARPFANRQRSRRRGSADQPEAATSSSEIEELLMMLEERNDGRTYPIIRAPSQKKGEQNGQQFESSEKDRHQLAHEFDVEARKAEEMSQARRTPIKPTGLDGKSSYLWLEGALNDIRSAAADLKPSDSLVPQVLKIIRDYLDVPAEIEHAPQTLKAVRERLLALPQSASGANRPSARNMHFFLPILLLNASRPRTGAQRGIGKAAIDSILRRYLP